MGPTTEKWILRKACADLLPNDLTWRKKAQFDEGSGTVSALEGALAKLTGKTEPLSRVDEAALYESILREQFQDADRIIENAGHWEGDRVANE